AHRSDDDNPYVYMTDDFGQTWIPIHSSPPPAKGEEKAPAAPAKGNGPAAPAKGEANGPAAKGGGNAPAAPPKGEGNGVKGLPMGSTRCLREDTENENVLYLGTEFSVYASIDRGKSWTKISNNLPTVAVHEIAVHPTAGEIVAATHGRSLWILDVSALPQMKPPSLDAAAHLFKPHTATPHRPQ